MRHAAAAAKMRQRVDRMKPTFGGAGPTGRDARCLEPRNWTGAHAKGDRRESPGCSHTSRWCERRETLQPSYATPSTDWRRDDNGCAPSTGTLIRASIAQITSLSGALVPKPERPAPGLAPKSRTANHAWAVTRLCVHGPARSKPPERDDTYRTGWYPAAKHSPRYAGGLISGR